MQYVNSMHYTKEMTLAQYIEQKIKMLKRDFFVELTESEMETIRSLETEIGVDRYARKLIFAKL